MKSSGSLSTIRGGAVTALLLVLPACRGNGNLEALQRENAELRERNAALETSNREKDLQIADFQSRGGGGDTG